MKNLTPYENDCFEIHKEAVRRKHKGDLKTRLTALNPQVELEYKNFLEKFDTKTLGLVTSSSALSSSKDDLHTLYSYQSKVIISVREDIRKLQIKTIVSTCQNCTIDSANTLDHLLPRADYPEFIVNPKNLFPCCSTCNSYKLDTIEDGTGQKFLNLYLDELPEEQYLFVKVFSDVNGEIDFMFYLENVDEKIPSSLFSIVKNHYEKLRLFERMKLKSIEHVSELETKILTFKRSLSVEEIVNNLIESAKEDKKAYGQNHWRCILEIALLNSPAFIEKYKNDTSLTIINDNVSTNVRDIAL